MFVTIGKRAATGDVVDMLLECHTRIRRHTEIARHLAAAHGAPAGEIVDAARAVHRYFSVALPLHVADEEESVVPRLVGREPEVDAALARMGREHDEHRAPLAAMLAHCEALAATPERQPELGPELGAVAARLDAEFAKHLELEERVILPAMRRLLDAPTLATIASELAARRRPA